MSYRVISIPRNRQGRGLLLSIALIMVIMVGRVTSMALPQTMTVSSLMGQDYRSEEARKQFIVGLGWEVEPTPVSVKEVTIPQEFNDVYLSYNSLQKKQGYNLEKYKGKKVMGISYKVLNYPDKQAEVRLNLLIYKGKIIGGDVHSLQLDGFIQGLKQT